MTGQNPEIRWARFLRGQCPTHGHALVQGDRFDLHTDGGEVVCPRTTCPFRAMVLWNGWPGENAPLVLHWSNDPDVGARAGEVAQ